MLSELAATHLAATDQPAQAGPLGMFVVLLLAVAIVLLVRSMSRHLRRIPRDFDPPGTGEPDRDDRSDHSGSDHSGS